MPPTNSTCCVQDSAICANTLSATRHDCMIKCPCDNMSVFSIYERREIWHDKVLRNLVRFFGSHNSELKWFKRNKIILLNVHKKQHLLPSEFPNKPWGCPNPAWAVSSFQCCLVPPVTMRWTHPTSAQNTGDRE